jgi:hypothetical protein
MQFGKLSALLGLMAAMANAAPMSTKSDEIEARDKPHVFC